MKRHKTVVTDHYTHKFLIDSNNEIDNQSKDYSIISYSVSYCTSIDVYVCLMCIVTSFPTLLITAALK